MLQSRMRDLLMLIIVLLLVFYQEWRSEMSPLQTLLLIWNKILASMEEGGSHLWAESTARKDQQVLVMNIKQFHLVRAVEISE